MYKPRTCEELCIFQIELKLKKIKKGKMTIQEAGINRHLERLKQYNVGMAEDLQKQYVQLVRQKSSR